MTAVNGEMTTVERDKAMFDALSVSEGLVARKAAEFIQVRKEEKEWSVTCIGKKLASYDTEEGANRFAKQERVIVKGKLREFVFDLKVAEASQKTCTKQCD